MGKHVVVRPEMKLLVLLTGCSVLAALALYPRLLRENLYNRLFPRPYQGGCSVKNFQDIKVTHDGKRK